MKKIIKYIFTIFLLLISITKTQALSISKNELTIEAGSKDSVELYANVESEVNKIEFTLIYNTYDIPANFVVNSSYTDTTENGTVHSVTFSSQQSGKIHLGTININVKNNPSETKGIINLSNASATTSTGEKITLNYQTINVNVGTSTTTKITNNTEEDNQNESEDEDIDYNLLDKIESSIVEIKLKKDIFEYTVNIKSDIDTLDLKPIAKDSNTKINITTQKIDELKDGKITITAKNNDIEKTYTINVKTIRDVEEIEIDNQEFTSNNSYKGKWIILTIFLGLLLITGLFLTKKK